MASEVHEASKLSLEKNHVIPAQVIILIYTNSETPLSPIYAKHTQFLGKLHEWYDTLFLYFHFKVKSRPESLSLIKYLESLSTFSVAAFRLGNLPQKENWKIKMVTF